MENYSQRVKKILANAKKEAVDSHTNYIGTEHLLWAMLNMDSGKGSEILEELNVDLKELKHRLKTLITSANSNALFQVGNLPFSRQAERALQTAILELKVLKNIDTINSGVLLISILRNEEDPVSKLLGRFNVTYTDARSTYRQLFEDEQDFLDDIVSEHFEDDFEEDSLSSSSKQTPPNPSNKRQSRKSNTPVLDNFGRDLTALAEKGKLDPVIGRNKEIERVSQILSRRKKNNPLLIGEPGVGKSAIAEGLALRIIQRKVSRILYNKRVVTLDLASLVAGTKYRGQFEERMKAVMNELAKNDDIILFIDEIHTIVGAGGAVGSLDASNMFKPALARGEIQCIGATTLDEYRQSIEKDGALERRFQKVIVDPTSVEETIEILHNVKDKYEQHHSVVYTDEAIEACVKLTNRYLTERFLPDKALDALDEAGSRIHITQMRVPKNILELEKELEKIKESKNGAVARQKYEEAASLRDQERRIENQLEFAQKQWEEESSSHRDIVTEEHIADVISMMSGIPVNRIAQTEMNKLSSLGEVIKGKIIGQDIAVEKIIKAIKRNRTGLKDPNKPIGSFIFLGQTGVGKTQLAKVLAKELFDSEDTMIRIDMSEYMEKFSTTRLIGAPPGYVGYEEGGQLTEKVRRKPYSVILLDEIEKAHPDIFNTLLQVLDDGFLTDSLGRKVDFRNCIIIMTSNVGARQVKDFGQGIGFGTSAKLAQADSHQKSVIENALKKVFAPEFLNRIDDVIVFNALSKEDIFKIIDIELQKLYHRINDLGYTIELSEKAKEFIADKGYDKQYGARPLKRAIQKYIEDLLAEKIVASNISEGDVLFLDLDSENEVLNVEVQNKNSTENQTKSDS